MNGRRSITGRSRRRGPSVIEEWSSQGPSRSSCHAHCHELWESREQVRTLLPGEHPPAPPNIAATITEHHDIIGGVAQRSRQADQQASRSWAAHSLHATWTWVEKHQLPEAAGGDPDRPRTVTAVTQPDFFCKANALCGHTDHLKIPQDDRTPRSAGPDSSRRVKSGKTPWRTPNCAEGKTPASTNSGRLSRVFAY